MGRVDFMVLRELRYGTDIAAEFALSVDFRSARFRLTRVSSAHTSLRRSSTLGVFHIRKNPLLDLRPIHDVATIQVMRVDSVIRSRGSH